MAEVLTRRAFLAGFDRRTTERPATAAGDSGSGAAAYRIATVSDACLETRGFACRMCADACEQDAIGFRPRRGGVSVSINEDTCTGCGACIVPCPTGAITLAAIAHGAVA